MGAALVGMTGNAVFILPDEHGVVVFFVFVDKPGVDEGVQHVTLDVPLFEQIGIDPAHSVVNRRQFELLFFHLSLFFCWQAGACRCSTQQERDGIRVAEVVKGLGEGDRASAFFRRMIVPRIAPDRDAVVTVQPLLMAGGKQFLSTKSTEAASRFCSSVKWM